VNGLEDLRGMKIRTQGPNARIMSQFGVIPVGMPVMEVYDALSKGMVDGITTTYAAMKMWSLGDLIKYAIEYRGSSFVALAVVAMNKDKWNAIPPDLQKIIEDINKEWVKKHTNVQEMAEKVGKDYVISKGVQVSRLSSEENAKWTVKANVLFDEYVANMKQKNLPGDEAVRFVRDIVKNAR
jgi:TRAP-type C4-dicarboxylate transport system substrate-binding protein